MPSTGGSATRRRPARIRSGGPGENADFSQLKTVVIDEDEVEIFGNAEFIWTRNLKLDNFVLARYTAKGPRK